VKRKSLVVQLILFLIVLFSNAPTGMPRFQVAAFYIPLLIVYFGFLKKNINYALFIIMGVLFLFPLLNQFRYMSDSYDLELKLNTDMFAKEDFDSYQNALVVIKTNEITYGRQLLGAALFFVPRSLWKNKPVGSGNYLAEKNNYEWSNIGLSYFGEGFINLGYFGVVLFSLALSYVSAKLDCLYWNFENNTSLFFDVFYLLMLGILFFLLRGDLLNTFAYAVGVGLCVKFLFSLLKFTKIITLFK
jgi:oligosaccharide repeat unit polymerase